MGDLCTLGNLAPAEPRKPFRFTTNPLGFRCTPYPGSDSQPSLLVTGANSYTLGTAMDDAETLSEQLARKLERPVFNGARYAGDRVTLSHLDWLLNRTGEPKNGVLYVYLDRWELDEEEMSPLAPSRTDRLLDALTRSAPSDEPRWPAFRRTVGTWFALWPARSACARVLRNIQNDRILPNPGARQVRVTRDPSGERFLLLSEEVKRCARPPTEAQREHTAKLLVSLRDHLAARGLPLRVLLMPNKTAVYASLLKSQLPEFPEEPGRGLERIAARLQAGGVPHLNLYPSLSRLAAERARSGRPPLFYREDTHWTPETVAWVAGQAAEHLFGRNAL